MIEKIKAIFKKQQKDEVVSLTEDVATKYQKELQKQYPGKYIVRADCKEFEEEVNDGEFGTLTIKYDRTDFFLMDKSLMAVKKLTGAGKGDIVKVKEESGRFDIKFMQGGKDWVIDRGELGGNFWCLKMSEAGFISLEMLVARGAELNSDKKLTAIKNAKYEAQVKRILNEEFENEG